MKLVGLRSSLWPAIAICTFGPHGAGSQRPFRSVCPTDQSPYELLRGGLDELLRAKVVTPAARKDAELLVWSTVHGLANILSAHSLMNQDSIDVEQVTFGIVRRLLRGLRAD